MVTPSEALRRLVEGNRRFVAAGGGSAGGPPQLHQAGLVAGQSPFAVLLGCSDSRVPAELVFDQGFGDLFVIRVAGNIVAPSQVGSVEFAVERFGTRLILVLGHSLCGAIEATIEVLENPSLPASPNLLSIVNRVRPAVEPLMGSPIAADHAALVRAAVRANVSASMRHLRGGSELLEALAGRGEIAIVGAEYDLATGVVEFHERPDEEPEPGVPIRERGKASRLRPS